MLKNLYFFISLIGLMLLALSPVAASDLKREKRMADEIVDAILDGEAVYLEANGQQFLSIYTEAEETIDADNGAATNIARGTAIILHGRGFHPDWQDAINPLRVGLTESGWNTLSVQMPVLEKQAKYYDYLPLFPQAISRIDSAIVYAREQEKINSGMNKVVLIAHSCGAHMAMAWAEAESFEVIDAYVGIGMGATDYKQPMKHVFPLEKMKVPILDVYAENDYPAVLKMAPQRLAMIKTAANEKSAQQVVADSDHYYKDRGEALTRIISQWLQKL